MVLPAALLLCLAQPALPAPEAAAARLEALRRTLPPTMTVVYEPPFVVVGDEAPARVRERVQKTVRWATTLLLKDFFDAPPHELHEVWMLGTPASYRKVSRELFHVEPETPYGYYLPDRRALVMNIGPGHGTLTHELVHPFMREAWPTAPAWLNEGLASLFEFPFEKGGHLRGRVNWRLPGLQAGLKRGATPSFFVLAHLSPDAFYDDPRGLHYAQARYLCYWLQEQGLLVRFVRRAIELKDQDPTGWRALGEALGSDPDALRPRWERFVAGLDPRS